MEINMTSLFEHFKRRRSYLWRLFSLFALILLGLTSLTLKVEASNIKSPEAHQCSTCLHNATERIIRTVWGVSANITYSNPLLKGGLWSFHRVAVANEAPYRFIEWGWYKDATGIHGLVVYNTGSGSSRRVKIEGVSPATHRYSMQYDPNTKKYWVYLDGKYVYNANPNFSSGTYAVAGGEVATGVERMSYAYIYNLQYLKKNADGTFVFAPWNNHLNYVDDPPYYNPNGPNLNSFYDAP
jgi:hypothetical protein